MFDVLSIFTTFVNFAAAIKSRIPWGEQAFCK